MTIMDSCTNHSIINALFPRSLWRLRVIPSSVFVGVCTCEKTSKGKERENTNI